MLNTLISILKKIQNADSIAEALDTLVHEARIVLRADACFLCVYDTRHPSWVMVASEGLKRRLPGQLRITLGQGLIGWIGLHGESLHLTFPRLHPDFYENPLVDEAAYQAFLGIPMIHQRKVLGVLVVEQEVEHRFDERDEAFLLTLATQMAALLSKEDARGEILRLIYPNLSSIDRVFHGQPCVSGIGVGRGWLLGSQDDLETYSERQHPDPQEAERLLMEALKAVAQDIEDLQIKMKDVLPPSELALFSVYLQLIASESLGGEMLREVRQGGWTPETAVRKVIRRHLREFESMKDAYLRDRGQDLAELGRRILRQFEKSRGDPAHYPEHTVLVGQSLTAADLADVPSGRLAGIISTQGSPHSHLAIIARAMKIPAVLGLEGFDPNEAENTLLIVDGSSGQVIVEPSEATLHQFQQSAEKMKAFDQYLEEIRNLPAETTDGTKLSLLVNVGLSSDTGPALQVGAEGVGLFRTEMPFMVRDTFPTEEEQLALYQQMLRIFSPHPVFIRTLDIGADKPLPYFPLQEANPALGWRGIRLTLDQPEIFSIQLRAMLKAHQVHQNLRIVFPMITDFSEWLEAKAMVLRRVEELRELFPNVSTPPMGIMVEVPSVVSQIDSFLEEVDFISIGTNDLTQYILACDRNNLRLDSLYDFLHPAVLDAIEHVLKRAAHYNKKSCICGEMAGDPIGVFALIGMGAHTFSISPPHLPRIKWMIRHISEAYAQSVSIEARALKNPKKIRKRLTEALKDLKMEALLDTVLRKN